MFNFFVEMNKKGVYLHSEDLERVLNGYKF